MSVDASRAWRLKDPDHGISFTLALFATDDG